MPHDRQPEAAHTILEADAWYETETGAYAVDCPECGAPATVSGIVEHGRCTAHLDQVQRGSAVDESELECTARLWFELGYTSEDTGGEVRGDIDEAGVPAEGEPPGTEGSVDET